MSHKGKWLNQNFPRKRMYSQYSRDVKKISQISREGMEKLLTTKELAASKGAIESSMLRWTDSGAIRTSRTVGGHRRIPLSEAIRFIRESQTAVVRPDVLGLGRVDRVSLSDSARVQNEATDRLFNALNDGDANRARAVMLGMYLSGASPAAIFDGPLGHALNRIGELWQHGPEGILIEHRASDICVQLVSELRRLLPEADAEAPVAVGAAPAGDPYLLPSMMAAAVMADTGYREINFGPHTPVSLLADAAQARSARVVWLSVSVALADDARSSLQHDVETLASALRPRNRHVVVGGRHAADLELKPDANVRVLQSMSELAAFARETRAPAAT
jgi:methanogenic corrinoid protein MtbC1